MKVLVTGSRGFIGKNAILKLHELAGVELVPFSRQSDALALPELLRGVDWVWHLAGVNRPQQTEAFTADNADLTASLASALAAVAQTEGKKTPVIYTSSSQADLPNAYGQSKRQAEEHLLRLHKQHGVPVHIFRLPNVFGKWARPNYNSVVATFCHNIARGMPIVINDPDAELDLVYIDDVIAAFVGLMEGSSEVVTVAGFCKVPTQYASTVGEMARQIQAFKDSRESLITERVGRGLTRALYATYLSYLPTEQFAYEVPRYEDPRGVFVEMLKTPESGQVSFFVAHPGVTRGGHYHHSKTEKFLVIAGQARFKFRHMETGQEYEICTSGDRSEIVETVPGWTHDITNVGSVDLVVMLWANEIFDRKQPDTFACPL